MRVAIFSSGIVIPAFIKRFINGLSESNIKFVDLGNENESVNNYYNQVPLWSNPKDIKSPLFLFFRVLKAFFICFSRIKQSASDQKKWSCALLDSLRTWHRPLPATLYLPNEINIHCALGAEYCIFFKKIYSVKFVVCLREARQLIKKQHMPTNPIQGINQLYVSL